MEAQVSVGSMLVMEESRTAPRTSFADATRPKPNILVLEERHGLLYTTGRLLAQIGYVASTIYEESHALASILSIPRKHFILLTARTTTRPLYIPSLIHRLRELHYDECITFCSGDIPAEVHAAYEDLSVDRFLVLPPGVRYSTLSALGWLDHRRPPAEAGLTILEM